MFGLFKTRRRRKLLAEPFPAEWLDHLRHRVPVYAHLPEALQQKLRDALRIIVAEKDWVGCGGLEMTDEVRVTIAAHAAVLLLGVEDFYFDRLLTVLVYPDAFVRPAELGGGGLIQQDTELLGEAWGNGPITLSWKNVLRSSRQLHDGHNVVYHEFAHKLDGLNGQADGTPPLPNRDARQRWYQVTEQEYNRLVRSSELGKATLLDHYGATNHAEFFAVATECFFERPGEMRQMHPELYGVLSDFYRLDPAQWFA